MALACVGHGLHEWRRKPLPWRGFGILSLARRLEVIADDLEMCRNQALALRIEDYWGTTSKLLGTACPGHFLLLQLGFQHANGTPSDSSFYLIYYPPHRARHLFGAKKLPARRALGAEHG
jgi:hypothetical protein